MTYKNSGTVDEEEERTKVSQLDITPPNLPLI